MNTKPSKLDLLAKEQGVTTSELLLSMFNSGLTQIAIAEQLGLTQATISYHVQKFGIQREVTARYTLGGEQQ